MIEAVRKVLKSKNQRKQTIHNLGMKVDAVEEAVENAKSKIKKVFSFKKVFNNNTEDKVQEMQVQAQLASQTNPYLQFRKIELSKFSEITCEMSSDVSTLANEEKEEKHNVFVRAQAA